MSSNSRSRVLSEMAKSIGYAFEEENLSPNTRKQIFTIAQKMDLIDELLKYPDLSKKASEEDDLAKILLTVFGLLSLFFGLIFAISRLVVLSIIPFLIAFVFLALAYSLHRRYSNLSKEVERRRTRACVVQKEIDAELGGLCNLASKELSMSYEARVRPTVRHLVVDFADIIQQAKGMGIILTRIECPYCMGDVEIPKQGDTFKCLYCGKVIHATKVLDKLKDILGTFQPPPPP